MSGCDGSAAMAKRLADDLMAALWDPDCDTGSVEAIGRFVREWSGWAPVVAVPGRVWGTRWQGGFVTEYPTEAEARRAMTNDNPKTLVYADIEWKEAQ